MLLERPSQVVASGVDQSVFMFLHQSLMQINLYHAQISLVYLQMGKFRHKTH